MLKVKGGYQELYPILTSIDSSSRKKTKESSPESELASPFYTCADSFRHTITRPHELRWSYVWLKSAYTDSSATESACGVRDRRGKQVGANDLPHSDMSQAYSTGVVENNQMKLSVLRGAPKCPTWGEKRWSSSRDVYSHNTARLSKIERNSFSWFESYFWCCKTSESKRGSLDNAEHTSLSVLDCSSERTPQIFSFPFTSYLLFSDLCSRKGNSPLPIVTIGFLLFGLSKAIGNFRKKQFQT